MMNITLAAAAVQIWILAALASAAPDLDPLLDALNTKNWYMLAALIVSALVGIAKASPGIWGKLPTRLQWLPALLLGTATGFVDAYREGLVWYLAIAHAVFAGLQIGGGAIAFHHTAKRVFTRSEPPVPTSSSGGSVRSIAPPPKPPSGDVAAFSALRPVRRLAVALAVSLAITGCALFQEAKPVLRTVDDVATNLCAIWFSERQGISIEDAARTLCNEKRKVQPWIDQVLAAQQAAGAQAAAKQ